MTPNEPEERFYREAIEAKKNVDNVLAQAKELLTKAVQESDLSASAIARAADKLDEIAKLQSDAKTSLKLCEGTMHNEIYPISGQAPLELSIKVARYSAEVAKCSKQASEALGELRGVLAPSRV